MAIDPFSLGNYDSTKSRYLQSLALRDSKETRKELILRSQELLETLLTLLPSNYISDILGPNYTQFLNAIAIESAILRLSSEDVLADNHYVTTRAAFLFTNLGYLLHDVDVKYNVPASFSDEKYRSFLLSILAVLLNGARPSSIESGVQIFTKAPTKVVELFEQTPPRDPNGIYDISDQFKWRYDITVTDQLDAEGLSLQQLQTGLEYLSEVIRPAHTLYLIRFIFAEIFKLQAGCRTLLEEDGYFSAYKVIRDYSIKQTATIGIIDNRVEGILDFIQDDFLNVAGVPVKIQDDAIIEDASGIPLTIADLVEGDGLRIDGFPVNPQIDNGFLVKQKLDETAFCDNSHNDYADYDYDDARKCCDELRKLTTVLGEELYNPNILGNRVFRTRFSPITKAEEPVRLADSVDDVKVYINGILVGVDEILPVEGTIVLIFPPPPGATVTINYSYFPNPILTLKTNTAGLTTNGWGPSIIGNVVPGEATGPSNYAIQHRCFTRDCEDTDIDRSLCDPVQWKWGWEAFDINYSSLTNSRSTLVSNFWDYKENKNRTNSYHVLSNEGPRGTKIGGPDPNYNDWSLIDDPTDPNDNPIGESLHAVDSAEFINWPTPPVVLTQSAKRCIAERFEFTDPYILNSLGSIINDTILLNESIQVIGNDYMDPKYSRTKFDILVDGTGLYDLSPACDEQGFNVDVGSFEETYEVSGGLTYYLITNFWPVKAIAASPVTSFELDREQQLLHSLNYGKTAPSSDPFTSTTTNYWLTENVGSEFEDFPTPVDQVRGIYASGGTIIYL